MNQVEGASYHLRARNIHGLIRIGGTKDKRKGCMFKCAEDDDDDLKFNLLYRLMEGILKIKKP